MTIPEKHRNELVDYRLEQAHKTLEDIEFLIHNKRFGLAINRIYYGIFYLLSALAIKHQFETSKHQQLIGCFNKDFVKTGLFSSDIASVVHKAFSKRSKSDYAVYAEFSEEETSALFAEMKLFFAEIKILILK